VSDPVFDIIRSEVLEPPMRVSGIMDAIEARHPDRVQAFVYYGSSLREIENPEKMLDFYVLVDSYRKTHGSLIRAWLNQVVPPAVYYIERELDGVLSTCKYSIMTLKEFEKRSGKEAFHSQVWGRFSQPCVLLRANSEAVADRVHHARAKAVRYMASQFTVNQMLKGFIHCPLRMENRFKSVGFGDDFVESRAPFYEWHMVHSHLKEG